MTNAHLHSLEGTASPSFIGQSHPPHGHRLSPSDSAFALAIGLNLAFGLAEAYAGWRANSLALGADAGHNLGDVAVLMLAWAGVFASRMRPGGRSAQRARHATIVVAFFSALVMLFAMGSLAWEALRRLHTLFAGDSNATVAGPHAPTMVVVAFAGIVVNGLTAWLFGRGKQHDVNLRGAYVHMRCDTIISFTVLLTGLLVWWQQWTWLDPAVGFAIALALVVSTWRLFRQSMHVVFEGSPDYVDVHRVRKTLLSLPGVAVVDDLHVWGMGSTQVALSAHLVVPNGTGDNDTFLRQAVRVLQERHGFAHVTLQVERETSSVIPEPFLEPTSVPRARTGPWLATGQAG